MSSASAPNDLAAARALIAASVPAVSGTETVALPQAVDRVLTADVIAPRTLPPADNSGVDGYAFRRASIAGDGPATLTITGESAAGLPLSLELPVGHAARISTGAVLPRGADTVIMQEDTTREGSTLHLQQVPQTGAYVRCAGEDIRVGDIAAHAGRRVSAGDLALLISLGIAEVPVRRRLRVAIIGTGTELRTLDDGRGPPAEGQIFDSNRPMLQALLRRWPVDATLLPILPDDRVRTERALGDAARQYDLILSTGGVSVGDHDHVRPALEALGTTLFWRLPLRPGRPVLLGRIGDSHLLGLPGNPVSVLATFALLGRPVLAALCGMTAVPGTRVPVRLAGPYKKPAHLNEFVRARLQEDGTALLFRSQGSNLLSSLSWADGLLDMPAGRGEFAAGDEVSFLPFAGLLD